MYHQRRSPVHLIINYIYMIACGCDNFLVKGAQSFIFIWDLTVVCTVLTHSRVISLRLGFRRNFLSVLHLTRLIQGFNGLVPIYTEYFYEKIKKMLNFIMGSLKKNGSYCYSCLIY